MHRSSGSNFSNDQILFIRLYQAMVVPKRYPTNAVRPIAIVPHSVILHIAFQGLDPPVRAATTPNSTRKIVANPY